MYHVHGSEELTSSKWPYYPKQFIDSMKLLLKYQWYISQIQKKLFALAGVGQWTERQPANQGVTGSIPSQGTCLGCRPCPQLGAHERQPHIDISLPLSPSLLLSKAK